MSKPIINKGFCFWPDKIVSVNLTQNALKEFSKKLIQATKLEGTTPIFLDTNVLLDYYKISFTERTELKNFFQTNKDRIYLTKQIETEFLRHRIDHIKSYLKSLEEFVNAYRNIRVEIEKLKNGEIKGFDHYLSSNIILKNDYQDLKNELSNLNETIKFKLKTVFTEIDFEKEIIDKEKKIEDIKKRLEGEADIERNDPLLEVIANFKVTDLLSDEEFGFIKNHYEELSKNYEQFKSDNNVNWKHTFPGCGEKKDDPHGDFIIFHEMIKFMKDNKSDVVFLTNDTEKNDWLLRNKTELLPYTHYIVNTFLTTNQSLFIFPAKDKIRVSYAPVYVEETKKEIEAKIEEKISDIPKLKGLTVLGKIEIKEKKEFPADVELIADEIDLRDFLDYGEYVDITEEEFLHELEESQKWAKRYGDSFVGVRSFIIKYLGSKGYHFRTTYDVKEKLVKDGKVELYTHKPSNSFFNEVEAIKITEKRVIQAT